MIVIKIYLIFLLLSVSSDKKILKPARTMKINNLHLVTEFLGSSVSPIFCLLMHLLILACYFNKIGLQLNDFKSDPTTQVPFSIRRLVIGNGPIMHCKLSLPYIG